MLLQKINYTWRVFATGLGFSIFGLGGLIFLVTVFPFVRNTKTARKLIRLAFKFFIELISYMGIISYELHNGEKLNRNGLLILANHPSLIDTVLLMAFVKDADCIVKSSLQQNMFTRGPVRAAGYICNNNEVDLIDDCLKSLQTGSNLTIFPEGTRTTLNAPLSFKRGAANIALRAHKNITPVVIRCIPKVYLSKGEKWWKVPPTKARFTIDVKDDIDIQAFTSARQLTLYLQDYFMNDTQGLQQLETEVKDIIITTLQLEDITVHDIDTHAALFGDGLGLDSIDALELGVALQKRYGISLLANSEETRAHFASVHALASMIDNFRKP